MHKSRLAGFIIDCQHADPSDAATFWSTALGMPKLGREGEIYERLDASARDLHVEVQRVDHPSRVHLDIESTDLEAEAVRLEAAGAKRVGAVQRWIVMEAPTGQRFCIVRAKDLTAPGFTEWP